MHAATFRNLGGSLSLTIPAALVKSYGFTVGEQVSLTPSRTGIVLESMGRKRYSAEDLVQMQGKSALAWDHEWDAMLAMGNEVAL